MAKQVQAALAAATSKGAYGMDEAAAYVGISKRSLYDWLKNPGGPKSFTLGARRLISKDQLDDFIKRMSEAA